MNKAETYLQSKITERKTNGAYRSLKPESDLIDFCSNDYLGFARSNEIRDSIAQYLQQHAHLNGSTGSRLLSGNTALAMQLELDIARFHGTQTGLLFNSGYDANIGLFASLPQRGDTVITDELIHASIIDGTRLSYANRYTFKHNDLTSLEDKLKQVKGNCYVAVESVYSMDGDTAPLTELLALTERYEAHLIVDEAHAVGVFDRGLVYELGLQQRVFASVVTFGKALGTHGAIVLGSKLLHDYLVNFARSFIYTTAAAFAQLAGIKVAYDYLGRSTAEQQALKENIALFKAYVKAPSLINSDSGIQCIVIGGNELTANTAEMIRGKGFDVRPILSPTVAAGAERIRICLHAFNTREEIIALADLLNEYTHG